MALAPEEIPLLASLLEKMTWPVPHEVFHALCKKTVTVPLELVVVDASRNRLLLIHRSDDEYEGYHLPGTVLRDSEDIDGALYRLAKGEVRSRITPPIPIGWFEVSRGERKEENPTRHEIALLHIAASLEVDPEGEFFPFNHIPADTLRHHKVHIERARDWLERHPF